MPRGRGDCVTSEPATGIRSVFDDGAEAMAAVAVSAWQIVRTAEGRLNAALAALRAHRSRRGLEGDDL